MKTITYFFMLLLVLSVQAQDKLFPDDYCGIYKGELVILNSQGEQRVPMEFHLQKTEDATNFTYKMIYAAEPNKIEKNYNLIIKDKSKGAFVIDENNGIRLDANFFDDTLHSVFEVQNNLIISTERFFEDRMEFSIIFTNKALSSSNEAKDQVPEVTSFPVSAVQKAVLLRQ